MSKIIVGIDFEPTSINTAVVSLQDRAKFQGVDTASISGGIDESGRVTEPQLVSDALKQIWKTNKYKSKKVALGIGSTQALVRPLTIPEMPAEQIKNELPKLVANLLPVSAENLILDFYPIEPVQVDDQPQIRGLLLAAPKENIYALVSTVEKAGLTPVSIDLNALSLLRFFAGRPEPTKNVVYVFASRSICHLVVTEQGVPSLVRSIPLSNRAAVVSEDSPAKEFAEFLATPAVIDIINREVSQTAQYFQQTHSDTKLDQIYLVGISFSDSNLAKVLNDSTKVEVKNIFKSASSHSAQNKDSVSNLAGYDEFATAIALAMTSGSHDGH